MGEEAPDPFAAGGYDPAPNPAPDPAPDNLVRFEEWREYKPPVEAAGAAAKKPPLETGKTEDEGGGGEPPEPPGGDDGGDDQPRPTWCSDDFLALKLADQIKDDFRYVPDWGWMRWNGQRWLKDDANEVAEQARENCRRFSAITEAAGFARAITSKRTMDATVSIASHDRRLVETLDLWDATRERWLLNTPAGIVNLKTGITGPHRREAFINNMTLVPPEGDCPNWKKFIAEFTGGDEQYALYLQRVAGYCLTGFVKRPAWFFIYGRLGGEGKSEFIHAVERVMGDYAVSAMMGTFMKSKTDHHPTETAFLRNRRLVCATETEYGTAWDEAKIKGLTGGDRQAGRVSRGDPFEYEPICKLLMSGNYKPRLISADQALRDRLNMLPAPYRPEEPKDLRELFEAELPGILKWMIDGAVAWAKTGLRPPQMVVELTDDYFVAQNLVARWFRDHCELQPAGVEWPLVKSQSVYLDFKDWQQEAGEKPWARSWFIEKLHGIRGVTYGRYGHGGPRGWIGFRLKIQRNGDDDA